MKKKTMKNKAKVKINIEGKTYQAEPGSRLIDVIKDNKIFLPSLCYFKHIDPPLGTCRVCTVMVNGRPEAACTVLVRDHMNVEINTPEMKDYRKALIEMMFAEGNHFCPACEKSGDCDLQHMGYELGVVRSRFPHLFMDKAIDFRPKRMLIEHNRCVLCRRCVEEVKTDEGKRVFSFFNRGNKTLVEIDYEQEAKLSDEQATAAMHLCPVGAILVKGKSLPRPFGERRFDKDSVNEDFERTKQAVEMPKLDRKKIVATTSLAGCFGCHMSMLDIDLGILDLVEFVEFNKSPITDIKEFDRQCDIGLIEGGCCNDHNVEVLKEFRKKCDVLVAVGECSIWGGLPAMRNNVPLEECLEEAYLFSMTSERNAGVIPYHQDIPRILDQVYACNDVVKIDYFIPGCPPNPEHLWKVVKNILLGEEYSILYSEFKYD